MPSRLAWRQLAVHCLAHSRPDAVRADQQVVLDLLFLRVCLQPPDAKHPRIRHGPGLLCSAGLALAPHCHASMDHIDGLHLQAALSSALSGPVWHYQTVAYPRPWSRSRCAHRSLRQTPWTPASGSCGLAVLCTPPHEQSQSHVPQETSSNKMQQCWALWVCVEGRVAKTRGRSRSEETILPRSSSTTGSPSGGGKERGTSASQSIQQVARLAEAAGRPQIVDLQSFNAAAVFPEIAARGPHSSAV